MTNTTTSTTATTTTTTSTSITTTTTTRTRTTTTSTTETVTTTTTTSSTSTTTTSSTSTSSSTTATSTTTTTLTHTTTPANGRWGSFLVIGDWGWDNVIHGGVNSNQCQKAIAEAMDRTTSSMGDVKFIINVGDSFYPGGVANKSDPQWDTKWRQVYSKEVRSVPWYSVYGNHDFHVDPCACSDNYMDCALVNGDVDNLDHFFMPSPSYIVQHPEMDVEVIALDMNYYTAASYTCGLTQCADACNRNLKKRMDAAFELFNQRMDQSTALNLLVFSHYPTDYFRQFPSFLARLRDDSNHHIEYFGGHRHNTDQSSTQSIAPNNNWLVGGGGGWGCEHYGQEQGFVVGEIRVDGTIKTYPVLVDYNMCCGQ